MRAKASFSGGRGAGTSASAGSAGVIELMRSPSSSAVADGPLGSSAAAEPSVKQARVQCTLDGADEGCVYLWH